MQADVSNEEQVQRMFAETIAEFGSLDVLVNNAGIQKPAPSHEIDAADFDRVLSVTCAGRSSARAKPSATSSRARRRSDSEQLERA